MHEATISRRDYISQLTPELFILTLEQIRPNGPLTTHESCADEPEVNHTYRASRKAFANLCLASRWTRSYATRYLYETVVLMNPKELLFFLRTLTVTPHLRENVRSFAWVGTISNFGHVVDLGTPLSEKLAAVAALTPACWATIESHRTSFEENAFRIMGIESEDTLETSRMLGVVLAMIPKVKWVFMLVAKAVNISNPVTSYTTSILPEDRVIRRLISRSQGAEFLQHVETISLEPHPGTAVNASPTVQSLFGLADNSPSLRRIEVKGMYRYQQLRTLARRGLATEAVAERVRELMLVRAIPPYRTLDHWVTFFPRLTSLEVDYNHTVKSTYGSAQEASEAIVRLSGTLQNLTLTTTWGGAWEDKDVPPLLPILDKLPLLESLKTESIWLFGTQNPYEGVGQLDTLSTTLVRLYIIDYWGTSYEENFYQALGSPWNVLEFYKTALTRLHYNCETRLHNLKSVTLASRCDDTALSTEFGALFASSGVQFNIVTPEASHAEYASSWANV